MGVIMMMLILNVISSFFAAFIMTNLTEWLSHKYILHGLGKKKGSFFHYHWQHHYISRKNNFIDPDYKAGFFKSSAYRREIYSLFGLLLTNITWLWVWPALFYWLAFFTVAYFWAHSKSHQDVEWCKKYLPHHYDHHAGINQDANWGVLSPFWDYVLGTRIKYYYNAVGKPFKI